MRPSEMVDGLDAVAKRSERQEQVERMKQRSGRIIMNEAVHVDGKGYRWQRVVLFSIIGFAAAAGGLFLVLYYLANSGGVSAQEAARDTRALLAQYTSLVYRLEQLPPGKDMSVEEFKQKLSEKINAELKERNEYLNNSEKNRFHEAQNARKAIKLLEKALLFVDGLGQPFIIERKEPGVFVIKSTSSPDAFTEVQVPRGAMTAENPL